MAHDGHPPHKIAQCFWWTYIMSESDEQFIRTVDGQHFRVVDAHKLCKKSEHRLHVLEALTSKKRVTLRGNSVLCRFRWLALALVSECLALLARSKTWPRLCDPEVYV